MLMREGEPAIAVGQQLTMICVQQVPPADEESHKDGTLSLFRGDTWGFNYVLAFDRRPLP